MLTPEYLEDCTASITEHYNNLQSSILEDIVRRILKMDFVTDSAVWQAEKLQEAGMLFDDILEILARETGISEYELRMLFEDAGMQTLAYEDRIHEMAGHTPTPLMMSPSMLQILEAGYQKTAGLLRNLTSTTAITSQADFIAALDEAYHEVISGAFSYTEAIKRAIRKLAENGTSVIHYGSGHKDKLDVAVRRAVLTGVNQTAGRIQLARMAELGCDLVETSAHAGARPSHALWQGQIYSISGEHRIYGSFVEETGYGSGEGLCGWNCRHSFHAFYDGISTRTYSADMLEDYNKRDIHWRGRDYTEYEASQIQRKFERNIREKKRETSAFNEAVKNAQDEAEENAFRDEFNNAAIALKNMEEELRRFTSETGQRRQRDREQVVGFGRSEAMKAVWAKKKSRLSK